MEEDRKELERLKEEIEATRERLYQLIYKKQEDLVDDEVIKISQELDVLLNAYEEILKKNKNMPNNI